MPMTPVICPAQPLSAGPRFPLHLGPVRLRRPQQQRQRCRLLNAVFHPKEPEMHNALQAHRFTVTLSRTNEEFQAIPFQTIIASTLVLDSGGLLQLISGEQTH